MKIAILIEGWKPIFGGGQVHVEYLCKHLVQDHNAQVDLLTRKLIDEDKRRYTNDETHLDNKWRIYRVGPIASFFSIPARIIHLIVFTCWFFFKAYREKYDIIHAHALLPGLPAKIVGFLLRIPVIYTVHGTMHLDSGKKDIYYYIEKYLVTKIKYTTEISVSHKIFDYKNVNKNIPIVYNGVDMKAFDEVTNVKKHSGLHFITVARIDWQKNHECMIKAIAEINPSVLDNAGFNRNIVGDGVLRGKCEALVKEYSLEKYISFKGKLFGSQLIQEYKRNHVFVLPSLAEGQPLTIFEAFAAKLPIILTNVGDNKYLAKDNVSVTMIPANDIAALSEALLYYISKDKAYLENIGEKGYELVKQEYDWKIMVSKTYAIYQEARFNSGLE